LPAELRRKISMAWWQIMPDTPKRRKKDATEEVFMLGD